MGKIKLLFLTCFLFLFNACSDVNLSAPEVELASTRSIGGFCISPPDETQRFTKFLFVMDKSGSNDTTDPGANKRAGNFEQFYNDNKDNDFFKWGMIDFHQGQSEAFIINPYFTQDEPTVRNAVNLLRAIDVGSTPYRSALSLTLEAIQSDMIEFPEEDSIYQVFFISDGGPTDTKSVSELRNRVRDIINLQPGRVFLSTAYYGPNNSTNINYLRQMADEGRGAFINFENSDELDFNDLIVQPEKEPWQLKRMMTFNTNAGFCLDGSVDTDSDADGLCDKDEIATNEKYADFIANNNLQPLDPAKHFSQTGELSGYKDYFIWRHLVFGEILQPCEDRTDEDFDLLTPCEEAYLQNDRPRGTEFFSGDQRNPDTDLDGFLDGIEILTFKDKGSANDDQNITTSFDGEEEDAGTQMLEHRNPLFFDPQQIRYDMRVRPDGINLEGQNCYTFQQNILPTYPTLEVLAEDTLPGLEHGAGGNIVYLYYIQTPQSDKDGPGVLKYSFQELINDGRRDDFIFGLQVNDDVFGTYVVPEDL